MGRKLSLGLAALVAIGVAIAIVTSVTGGSPVRRDLTVVKGVIGSEKLPFFQDKDVKDAFADAGFEVQVDTAGSRRIATSTDLSKYDFAFPAGVHAGEKIRRDLTARTSYVPFFTPMVIASFQPIADMLTAAGVVKNEGALFFDMKAYLDLVAKNTRWNGLPNPAAYNTSKSVLITSTDVRSSNSAAMYLGLASYVQNGNDIVQNEAQAAALVPTVSPLFLRQGYTETSSEGPFEDYLSIGIGKVPMVMAYESQFLSRAAAGDRAIRPEMVLMYPQPTILSKHTLVPVSEPGDRVGQLLMTNKELQRLAVKYGFRTSDPTAFSDYLRERNIPKPPDLIDVIEPPTYEVLERMIAGIEGEYTTPTTQEQP